MNEFTNREGRKYEAFIEKTFFKNEGANPDINAVCVDEEIWMIVEDETNFEDGYRTVVVENSKKKRRKLNIPVGEGNKDQLVQLAGIDLVKIGRRFKM